MSKGWESKNVEEQRAEQESAAQQRAELKPKPDRGRADNLRAQQSLELQREQILNQRTSNPHRRLALAAALAQIEDQLSVVAKKL